MPNPGTPLAFPYGDVHQLDSEERNLLSAYTAPDIGLHIGLRSHTTRYTYSPDGELELVTRPDALSIDPSYDSAGRLSQLSTPRGSIDYFYFGVMDPIAPGKLEIITSNIDAIDLTWPFGFGASA